MKSGPRKLLALLLAILMVLTMPGCASSEITSSDLLDEEQDEGGFFFTASSDESKLEAEDVEDDPHLLELVIAVGLIFLFAYGVAASQEADDSNSENGEVASSEIASPTPPELVDYQP